PRIAVPPPAMGVRADGAALLTFIERPQAEQCLGRKQAMDMVKRHREPHVRGARLRPDVPEAPGPKRLKNSMLRSATGGPRNKKFPCRNKVDEPFHCGTDLLFHPRPVSRRVSSWSAPAPSRSGHRKPPK